MSNETKKLTDDLIAELKSVDSDDFSLFVHTCYKHIENAYLHGMQEMKRKSKSETQRMQKVELSNVSSAEHRNAVLRHFS